MITLYGSAHGRPSRSLFALEELGLSYRHVPLRPWADTADRDEVARLNPNARVPILDDDGFVLWESMAINMYLAERAGGPLWPADLRSRGRVYQWSLWAQTEMDVPARDRARTRGDPSAKAAAEAERLAVLGVLERALGGRPYLLGDDFSLADLNLASTLSEPQENGLISGDFDPATHGLGALADWLRRCQDRAAWRRVRALP
ncbi:MAG: glutathione S-transferase family protein [Caulobacterales bacterium]